MEQKNKILMIILAMLFLIIIFYLISPNIVGFISKNEYQVDNVKVATFAICEQKENYIICKDKAFAVCNKTPLEINETTFYCNNKTYNMNEFPSGEVYHPENWKDPRKKDFLTSWAISE